MLSSSRVQDMYLRSCRLRGQGLELRGQGQGLQSVSLRDVLDAKNVLEDSTSGIEVTQWFDGMISQIFCNTNFYR